MRARTAAAGAHWLDASSDEAHGRTVVTLAGAPAEPVLDALFALVALAVERIDLRAQQGVHPRVGAADVVPLVPLAGCDLDSCFEWAGSLAERVWAELRLPVYLYGRGVKLADVRAGRVRPAVGGPEHHPTAGAVCIGARPFLVAYNLLLPGATRAQAAEVARKIRESSGGLAGVQALAFELPGGIQQLSMNLVELDVAPMPRVLEAVRELWPAAGPEEVVGLCPAFAAGPAARGRLLEGRLASASAASAAEVAGAGRSDELGRLALRLEKEAGALAALGPDAEEMLAAAERCYALLRVLGAGGVLRPDVEAMLRLSARSLRVALPEEALRRQPERVRLLDARLDLA